MIERFLTYLRTEMGASPLTVKAYSADLKRWQDYMLRLGPAPGTFAPEACTGAQIRAFLAWLAQQGCSATTVRRKLSSIKAFYRFLMRTQIIAVNPAADLHAGRAPKPLPVFVRPAEMNAMIDEQIDETDFVAVRDRLILNMLYSTGMRSAELIGLADDNIDTRSRQLKVLGKRNKERIIPFGTELASMIDSYRALRADALGNTRHPEFFLMTSGRPLYRKALYNIVHRHMALSGIHAHRLSPHVMRHSFATDMLNNGADLNAVSHLLGHASLESTQVYTHITYRELKQNYQTAHPRALKKGENHGS